MRPFTVLIGIVLGTSAALTFSLAIVLIVLGLLLGRHPDLTSELPKLSLTWVAFAALTAASAGSFLGQTRGRSWRLWAHAATAIVLGAVAVMYWPHRG